MNVKTCSLLDIKVGLNNILNHITNDSNFKLRFQKERLRRQRLELDKILMSDVESNPSIIIRELIETKTIDMMTRDQLNEIIRNEIHAKSLNRINYSNMNYVLHLLPHVILYQDTDNIEHCNAEHVFPQSYFMGEKSLKTDLHHVFACDKKVNSTRSNYKFQQISGISDEFRVQKSEKKFNPPLSSKGKVARAMAYIMSGYPNILHFSDIINTDTIVIWNMISPVTDDERRRNNLIEKIQGNRNPFIDYPELINNLYGKNEIKMVVNNVEYTYYPSYSI